MVIIMSKIKYIIILLLNLIIIYKIIDIKYINYKYYEDKLLIKSNNILYGNTPKRGRILDRNNKVIVDNKEIYNVYFRNINNKNINDLVDISYKINEVLKINEEASNDEIKDFFIKTNSINKYLSDFELKDYSYRKISDEDIYNKVYERIDDDINYSLEERFMIHIYYLINKGYKSNNKLVKSNVTYEECLSIENLNINGLTCDISWDRINNYPMISSIVGNVSMIPKERYDYYLSKGYDSEDIVGISGLEEYYDDYLKGIKSKYKINKDNSIELIKDEIKGNDLILSLDIDLILKSYEILIDNFKLSKTLANTSFFNQAYIIISKPNTGEILSLVGLEKDTNKDISSLAITTSYTLGSIVKGASHTVGYLNNLIDVGKKIKDSCVKLYNIPMKCSFKSLGYIDDIDALKMSSNYYQFITAIKSVGETYKNNMKLDVSEDNFNTYRNIFKKYGLGSSTYIDYPKETYGLKGDKISADLLLNLSIGQYDTYSPIQIMSYINTIAERGKRYALSFKKQENKLVDEINLDSKYMDRIIKGFYEVVNNGTGRGYSDVKYKPAGKTGTAQNYYDKDVMTINSSYVMFAPYDDPKYSVVVITPNISYYNSVEYIAPINRLISKSITNYLFENY